MSTPRLDTAIERGIRATPARHVVDPRRARQVIEFCVVGGLGAVLDVAVTLALLGEVHYLAANAVGFLVAVTFNFGGNYLVTFDRPSGSLPWQYGSYVLLHGATFAVRAVVVAVAVESMGVPAAPASGVGIAAAAAANYLGSERIFGGDGRVWFDLVDAVNHLAHVCYSSRLRRTLRRLGLYGLAYRVYQTGLALVYRAPTRRVRAGGASALIHTEYAPEIVSVLHTMEKEQAVLDRFVTDLRPDDVVWDVGANLGIFSVLAGDVAARVVAIEPHAETANRCADNLRASGVFKRATVLPVALGDHDGETHLALERDELGTQTGFTSDDAGRPVTVRRGDSLDVTTPTVVKIDVEGAEVAALDGLAGVIDDVRLVLVETHDQTFHDSDSDAVRERLDAYDFTVERLDAGGQTYYRGERR